MNNANAKNLHKCKFVGDFYTLSLKIKIVNYIQKMMHSASFFVSLELFYFFVLFFTLRNRASWLHIYIRVDQYVLSRILHHSHNKFLPLLLYF